MKKHVTLLISAVMIMALSVFGYAAKNTHVKVNEKQLIGTWKLVSAVYNNKAQQMPPHFARFKIVTKDNFSWFDVNTDTGKVTSYVFGTWKLTKDKYTETPLYGLGLNFLSIKGNTQSFKCVLKGNKWFHSGLINKSLSINEVWVRQ